MCRRARVALLAAGSALAVSCAPRPSAPPVPTSPTSSCSLTSDSAGPERPVTAEFDGPEDARRAAGAASLLAPVRLDCDGQPLPGLAVAWSRDTSERFWTLQLDEPTRIDSGVAWTAGTLAAAWRADPSAAAALRFAGVESLLPLDERRLVVGFSARQPELPTVFADRSLGVTRQAPPSHLMTVRQPSGGDLRDAIDGGADLVRTSDPDLLEYAGHRPGLSVVALPWDRAYLLLVPQGSTGVGAAIPSDTSAFREALAHDAVRADARAAGTGSWTEAASCRRSPGPSIRAPASDAIAYQASDLVARDLAERLVALAEVPAATARGFSDSAFQSALQAGSERAYVVAVPVHATVPCRERADWPSAALVVPLIETRPHAILRRGIPPLAVEWDGTVVPR
jgi:hypothetical protein